LPFLKYQAGDEKTGHLPLFQGTEARPSHGVHVGPLRREPGGVLVGSVLRKALCVILQQKAFGHPDATGPEALELKAKQGK
jgi:hypothetical protein